MNRYKSQWYLVKCTAIVLKCALKVSVLKALHVKQGSFKDNTPTQTAPFTGEAFQGLELKPAPLSRKFYVQNRKGRDVILAVKWTAKYKGETAYVFMGIVSMLKRYKTSKNVTEMHCSGVQRHRRDVKMDVSGQDTW